MKAPYGPLAVLLFACTRPLPIVPPAPLPAIAEAKRPLIEHAGPAALGEPLPLLAILREELERNRRELDGRGKPPPYFLSYQVTDRHHASLEASFGALDENEDEVTRTLDVDLRVGDYRLDDTHPMPEEEIELFFRRMRSGVRLPLDDDRAAIAKGIWLATDRKYREAVEQLVKVKASQAIKTEDEDKSEDFSHEESLRLIEPTAALRFDAAAWSPRIKDYSRLFAGRSEVHESQVSLASVVENRLFVSSDNGEVQTSRAHVRLAFWASTTADDGMELFRFEAIDVPALGDLPADEEIRARIGRVIDDVIALRKAPIAEPYERPAILEGKAAGVFFHEIFGHRVEGHRQKKDEEGQTFAKQLGKQVMPALIDVYDDPTITRINGTFLNGSYRADNQGVLGQRAELVKDGVLQTFLMSRSPTRGITRSNGHARAQAGAFPVARQANLVVEPHGGANRDELKRRLLAEVARRGKPYGLRLTEVAGGFTVTERWMPQGFKVMPVMVYRVYPDGREELVRGVDVEGTPLATLTKILAAGDDYAVFNGVCGAESGWVPVSATSPSLLIEQLEVTRRPNGRDRPPLLSAPASIPNSGETR